MDKEIYTIINLLWQQMKSYNFKPLTESQWERLVLDQEQMMQKYKDAPEPVKRFGFDMCMAVVKCYEKMK